MKNIFVTLSAMAILLASCGESAPGNKPGNPGNPGTPPPVGGREAYVAKGRLVDGQGKPIAGAQVILDNTVYSNSGQTQTTGADGTYAFRLEQGSWRVYARITKQYHGRTYKLDLHPDTYDTFAGQDGAVRNFVWKLRGKQPAPGAGDYGGLVYIHNDPMTDFYDTANVVFTLTPDGPLIDGSQGQPIVTKHGAPRTDDFSKIRDVPIGRYTVTAVHQPSGKKVLLRLTGEGQYAERLTFDFAEELNYCSNCVALEVRLED